MRIKDKSSVRVVRLQDIKFNTLRTFNLVDPINNCS